MIYGNEDDSEECPAERGDLCLNCGKGWLEHVGWACGGEGPSDFSPLPPHARYITASMAQYANAVSFPRVEAGKLAAAATALLCARAEDLGPAMSALRKALDDYDNAIEALLRSLPL
jgi:hypothetical protein